MRFHWRHKQAREIDHELLWLAVGGASAIIGVIWLRSGLPTPPCRFESLTGIPCATCGSTRSLTCLVHGDLAGALAWNPLVFALAALAAILMAYAAIVLTFRLPRLRVTGLSRNAWKRAAALTLLILLANWAYILLHSGHPY